MGLEFNALQRKTLTAIVDTFVASVPRDDDPTGFYAAKGSDVGANVATEHYLVTHLPEQQLAGLLQLIDTAGLVGMKNQPQAVREAIIANLAGISPETAGAIGALHRLSVMFAYGLPDATGPQPLVGRDGISGPDPGAAANPEDIEVITPAGETTLEADVVVVGSGSGGGVAAAVLAQAGKRVIILEAGGYSNESDFIQLELAAYQNLFLRGGLFPSADGMITLAAGSTVGGGSTINWSNSFMTPAGVRACWANDFGLTDVDTPAFDEHLQAVFDRISCNDKVATQNEPHERLREGAARLGYSYRVSTLNIDPDRYDPNLIG